MYCSRCAAEVTGKQLFCGNCGQEIVSNRPGETAHKNLSTGKARVAMVLTAVIVPFLIVNLLSLAAGCIVFVITEPPDEMGMAARLAFFIPLTITLLAACVGLIRFYVVFLKRFKVAWSQEISTPPATASSPRPHKYLYRKPYVSPPERKELKRDTSYSAFQVGSLSMMPFPFFSFPFAALAFILVLKSLIDEKRKKPVAEEAGRYRLRACYLSLTGIAINVSIIIAAFKL